MKTQSSTGAGFTFSSIYQYDGMVYYGNSTYIQCAEQQKRYDECRELLICVTDASTHVDFLKVSFPLDYFKIGSSLEEITEMLFDDSCNVIAHEKSAILNLVQSEKFQGRVFMAKALNGDEYRFGEKVMSKEPLGIVTRSNDRVFSDIINWVIQVLLFGEEQGITKDATLCQNYTKLSFLVSDLDLMNAVYCVGNYEEIFDGEHDNRGMNKINNGTGMLYSIPFGDLDKSITVRQKMNKMSEIRSNGILSCGVYRPSGLERSVVDDRVLDMGVEYCSTLAAALFNGDPKKVVIVKYEESELSSYIALANGEIDVLVGATVQRKYDFSRSSSLVGFHFSTPYYYGDEAASDDVSFYSIATREGDALFASFVNCIVLATIYDQENMLQREKSGEMPLVSVFGGDFNWALRDAIAYSGSYDQIYTKFFGKNVTEALRGRNTLSKGGSLLLSLPRLP